MKFAEQYSYNEDGSVRGEFVTKEHGVIPLSFNAKMFGVNLMEKLDCRKSDFRGLLLGVKYVNDDGLACDSEGNPLEDEKTYAPLPDKKIEKWDQHVFISCDGESALDDEEWNALSPEEQSSYRKVDCMEVELSTSVPINGPIYLCKEAVVIMAELFGRDVVVGDPINERYQYECRHNTAFAAQYGFVLNMALKELQRHLEMKELAHDMAMSIAEMVFGSIMDDEDDEDDADKKPDEKPDAEKPDHEEDDPKSQQKES